MRSILTTLVFILIINIPTRTNAATNILVWREYNNLIVLDRTSLQKIFTRKVTRWPDGRNITVFIKPINSIEHKAFITNILQMRPFMYQQMLEQQIYSGKASSVVEINNDSQMIFKIESTPGSIGYIDYELYVENKKVIIVDVDSNM